MSITTGRLSCSHYAYWGKISPSRCKEMSADHAHQHDHSYQVWMKLLLSNILPNDHNADHPLQKYQLVCADH